MAKSAVAAPGDSRSPPRDDDYIPSLGKGLAVLELFGAGSAEWTLSQIAQKLELTPGTTRRILRTLEALGYVVSHEGRFSLTPRVLNLGFSYLSSQPFAQIAQPLVTRIAAEFQATCCITVLDEREVVFVARGTHRHIEPFVIHVGARLPAYATAPGKVLLAGLSDAVLERRLEGWQLNPFTPNTLTDPDELLRQIAEIRRNGYAINDQELFVGQRSIAVPLTLGDVRSAAMVVATPVGAKSVDQLISDVLGALQAAAQEFEQTAATLL
jgi:IclR family pca regulon transcriptional regulator